MSASGLALSLEIARTLRNLKPRYSDSEQSTILWEALREMVTVMAEAWVGGILDGLASIFRFMYWYQLQLRQL